MLEKGITLEKNITGKATNINELILQISALNAIRSTAEPTEEEVRENLGKIDKAVADLNQHLREERINSLLAKERHVARLRRTPNRQFGIGIAQSQDRPLYVSH